MYRSISLLRKRLKNARFETPDTPPAPIEDEIDFDTEDPDEIASGIKTKTANETDTDGLNITSVSVGHGDIGQNVGKVRRAG
jgi:hypothetical protein